MSADVVGASGEKAAGPDDWAARGERLSDEESRVVAALSAGAARASGEKAAGVDDCEARLSGEESRVDAPMSVGAVRTRGELSCYVRPDVSLTSADVRPQVT